MLTSAGVCWRVLTYADTTLLAAAASAHSLVLLLQLLRMVCERTSSISRALFSKVLVSELGI
jgi:hypothetical protein